MATLEQRLASILPAPAQAATGEIPLEPLPIEEPAESPDMPTGEPGSPDMDGMQVAGLGSILRKAVTEINPSAGRKILPRKEFVAPARLKNESEAVYAKRVIAERDAFKAEQADELRLPEAGKVGSQTIIPEASEKLTEKVGKAIKARKAGGAEMRTGKPSPSAEEAAMGVPVEPFNLSRYQTDDAAAVVGGVADALNIKTKRVTFDEIKQKAEASGISESFLARLVTPDGGMLPSAVDTYKALQVLESSSTELDRLFKLVDSGLATDVDKLALRQQIAFHGLVQKGVKGIQTETARALAVMRIPRDGKSQALKQVLDEFGGENALTDMAKSYLSLETRAAKNAMVEKSMMSGVKDVWMTTWINGLLSSPVTHAKNIMSNSLFGLYQIPERLVAGLYSNYLPNKLRAGELPPGLRWFGDRVPGSEAQRIELDEALTMTLSLRNAIAEGFELASKAWKSNTPQMDIASKIELSRQPMESMGESLQRMTGASADSWIGKGMDYYGTAITFPGRALMTEDEFFKGVLYRMEMNTQVTRRSKQIYRESLASGMNEQDAIAKATKEAEDLLANPPRDLDEAAMEFAKQGTFQADLPPALAQLQRVFNHPVGKIIVPFFKTPANIGLNVIERTPFAPLSSRWQKAIAAGGPERDMALAKVSLGSTVLTGFAFWAAEGNLTGRGPERKEEREALLRTGWQPYSMKLGDKWYSFQGMEPIGALMAIAADYAEYAKHEPDATKVEEVFLGATYGLYEYLKEQPYLQGIADVGKLIGFNESGRVDGEKIVNGLTKQFGGFLIGGSPGGAYSSSVAAIDRLLDPTKKDTKANPDLPMGVRGFVEAFNQYRSRLPYFSESVPESLNLWGDTMKRSQGNPFELILPTKVSPDQFSEVDDLLVEIGSPIGVPDRKTSFTVGQGEGSISSPIELAPEQYNRLLEIYGKETPAKQAILDTMNMPGFERLPLDQKQKTVQKIHSQFMSFAKQKLMAEYPEIQDKIMDIGEARQSYGIYYKPD